MKRILNNACNYERLEYTQVTCGKAYLPLLSGSISVTDYFLDNMLPLYGVQSVQKLKSHIILVS